uniref:Uncharacterized protein n=1 Tax=Bactrocera dorsalis TaxID=27457 RepID=A0A034WJD8_BACDO
MTTNFFFAICYIFLPKIKYINYYTVTFIAPGEKSTKHNRDYFIYLHTHTLIRSYNNFHASNCNCNTTYRKLHYQKLKRNTIILKPDKKYLHFQMQATHTHIHTHIHMEKTNSSKCRFV